MKTTFRAGVLLFLAMVAVPGCATRTTVERLEDQVRRLQQENFELRKNLTEIRVRQQIQAETATRPKRSRTVAEAPAARPSEPEDLPAERTGVIYTEPITDASRFIGAGTAPPDPSRGAASPGPAESKASILLMESAQASLDARDPEAALVHFREIVVKHPDDAMADDAQFGVGECYFQMGRYEEAISEYRRVIDNFPFGDRVAYAWLKIGFAHLALDQRDQALADFRTVSEGFPGTEAATVARQQIGHLSK